MFLKVRGQWGKTLVGAEAVEGAHPLLPPSGYGHGRGVSRILERRGQISQMEGSIVKNCIF